MQLAKPTKQRKGDQKLFGAAVKDIDRKIEAETKKQKGLQRELERIVEATAAVQNQERGLRDKIAKLVDKEAALNSKRLTTKEDIVATKEKIAELLRIKEELHRV